MKLARLLDLHTQHSGSPLALSTNLGDGFLVKNNKLFNAVRRQATQLGYIYSDAFQSGYLALPLAQLETILKCKRIPYFDNVSVIHDIETQIRNVIFWDEVVDNLKTNHVFHESCHAIARTHALSIFHDETNNDAKIVRLLIEESFSNACELLGIIYAHDTAHKIFYEANSYIYMHNDQFQLAYLNKEIGTPSTLRFLMGCYLFSNFLHEKITDAQLERLRKIIKINLPPAQLKIARSLSKIAFELNPRFRWVTTTFYLRLCGIKTTTEKLSSIDFLHHLETDTRFIRLIESITESVSILHNE